MDSKLHAFLTFLKQFAVGVALGFVITLSFRNLNIFPINSNLHVYAFLTLASAFVLYRGYTVRQFLKGKNPKLTGISASRTFLIASAAKIVSVVLAGYYIGETLTFLDLLQYEFVAHIFTKDLVTLLFSLLLYVSSLIALRWCQIPPPSEAT
ncbi:MAG: DUF3180 domain-containing protein [Bifidobacteriaceae bacterium]|nr:DUF3180 domain-containing protein [Bifidobacteriaceae bacterium]